MNKLIILVLTVLLMFSCKDKNPQKYKGCVVVDKNQAFGYCLYLKLTPDKSKEVGKDYYTINVPKWEWDQLNIGDTIK